VFLQRENACRRKETFFFEGRRNRRKKLGAISSEEIRLTTALGFRKSGNGCKRPSINPTKIHLSLNEKTKNTQAEDWQMLGTNTNLKMLLQTSQGRL
jgi:hypothetical protein